MFNVEVEHLGLLRSAREIHAASGMSEIARKASSEIKLALSEIAPLACLGDLSRRSFSEDGSPLGEDGRGTVWMNEIAAARRSEIVPERHNEIHACA